MTTGRILFLILLFSHTALFARENEGARENSLLLNGTWEYAVGDGNTRGETATDQGTLNWKSIKLPQSGLPFKDVTNETKFVLVRRTFQLTPEQAKSLAVLRWNRIAWGAEALINGRKVGENEPTGPYQVIVQPGVLKVGENQIVLKIRGAAGVRRSKSGNPMFPCGFGVGVPEVTDDIWIDFATDAYMKWVLAMPDLATGRVVIRVTTVGLKKLDNLEIIAKVSPCSDDANVKPAQAWKAVHTTAHLLPDPDPLGGEHFYVDVPVPGYEPWTYEKQPLYSANVKLLKDGKLLDETTFRFGMREIGVQDGNYKLNGKNLWLRGSNLVFEWNWADIITGKEVDYLVTEAREMSMNSFRTHTQPPNRIVSDVCDEHGTMLLAEFPVLYNYQDYKFTPEEYEIWHRNVLTDSAGWMARLWNHPSVVMWVLSNESNVDNKWEETVFQDFVNRLDPTRPTMRTGTTGTKDNLDVHTCGNITDTIEGEFLANMPYWVKHEKNRTLTNSEYMNYFGHPNTQWAGIDDSPANDMAVAQIGAEHTEAMRRARIDAILPYMYAGWTRTRLAARVRERGTGSAVWKANYASPLSAAWHSSLSPVLASLDLFDPDYLTGQEVTTDLYLINDSWHDANMHVDLLLTKENPEWIPEAACFDKPVEHWSYNYSMKSDTVEKTQVQWQLPKEEGNYWLTARLTGTEGQIKGRPVLSQRFVRAVHAPFASEALRKREFVILGADDTAREFFRSMQLKTWEVPQSGTMIPLMPEKHTIVIWDASHVTAEAKRAAARPLHQFAGSGGRVIVLATPSWNWRELCDVKIDHDPRFSRVFAAPGLSTPASGGIDPQWLIRWNGLPGTVAYGKLDGDIMKHAKTILWAHDPETVVMANVPAVSGKGKILFSQLIFQDRVNESGGHYDPVAARLLIRLLEQDF
ncbi:MAG: hypothetical protein FWC50_08935 [Planctomycetaceae bacterium]|nr:hypothetical protein [Planctomycetaceae bacterium]